MKKLPVLMGIAFLWLTGFAGAAELKAELPAKHLALLENR